MIVRSSLDRLVPLPVLAAVAGLVLAGCSESALRALPSPPDPPVQDDPVDDVVTDGDDDDATDPWDDPGGDNEIELPPCEDTLDTSEWDWWASQPFEEPEHPVDESGREFWEPEAWMVGWHTVVMPVQNIPPGTDEVFRATFTIETLPPKLYLSMQSDDGIAFWANGVQVGQWGGDWQEEGCVNDNANCSETTTVPPQDITDLLVEGENVVAARVSNAVMNAWFEVLTECVDD